MFYSVETKVKTVPQEVESMMNIVRYSSVL